MQDEATPFPELLTEAELLRPLGGAWVDRAHAYLSTGQPGSILDDLAAIAGDSPVADLLHVSRHSLHEELRRPWVASIEDPDVLLRLARFWTAAVVPGERPRHPFLPDWCAMLLVSSSTPDDRPDLDGELRPGLPASRVARALDAGGEHAEGLVRALLCQDVAAEWPLHPTWFAEFEDWSFLAEHTRLVHSLLARSSAEVTRSRLQVLSWTDADLGPLLNVLVHLACDRPATVRDVARRALWRRWQDTLPILCELATLERPSTRFEALWLIGQHHREAARPFLELRRAEETDARAKAIIALLLEPGVPVVTKVRETVRSEPPQRKRLAAPPAVTPEQRHLLEQLPRARGSWTRAALDELCASLCDPSPWRSRPKRLLRNQSFDNGRIVACVRSGRWSPIPLLRLLHHASCLPEAEPPFDFFDELPIGVPDFVRIADGEVSRIDVGEVAEAAEWAGYPPDWLAQVLLDSGAYVDPEWTTWPYFMDHIDLLAGCLGIAPAPLRFNPSADNARAVLAGFPAVPPELLPGLWQLAFGTKRLRAFAQQTLATQPDREIWRRAALLHPRSSVRVAAEAWRP